ncbi:MAG: class I SAM-dependent methyltransferase [Holosporales bacterium]|jgi:SAM-dependent methyltransferase|nr:class I SAM-dependent methyltransferase [Holosporales bacterium]
MKCRHCGAEVFLPFVDLGFAPPSNAYLTEEDLRKPEKYYPLRVLVCQNCWLAQTEDIVSSSELFNAHYAYFSSVSRIFSEHAQRYVEMITSRLSLAEKSFVVEIASNDGYLLRHFVKAGIPCLGIEPTASTATASKALGIPTEEKFFCASLGKEVASQYQQADLIIGNNVYAHVPDINDFTRGLKALLKPTGCITLEFHSLMSLIRGKQFDAIYHEHFSYLSLSVVSKIFNRWGLRVWDAEKISTHGESLRVYGCHQEEDRPVSQAVKDFLEEEERFGLSRAETYQTFQTQSDTIKRETLTFFLEQNRLGKRVSAYGAAAKASTLLNYAGIKRDFLPCICDDAVEKQGKYLPGSHIPILSPQALRENVPHIVYIFSWNIVSEFLNDISDLREKGVECATFIPKIKVF